MKTETVRYEADGLSMKSHLAWDSKAREKRPGVIVFPHAFGLDDHGKGYADRIARELGYVALGADLHGNGDVFPDFAQIGPLLQPLRTEATRVRARTMAAYNVLKTRSEVDPGRIAAIGFCYGGTMAFELALTGVDMRAAVGFHSGLTLTSPQDAGQIRGKILVLNGADDPAVPPEQRASFEAVMREGKVDWQMHLFGGVVHSFTDPAADARGRPEALRYDATAAARSWTLMADLFREVFG